MALHNARYISKAYREEHKHVPSHRAQQSQPKSLHNWKLWCDTRIKRARSLLLIKQMKLPLLKSKHLRFCTEHTKSVFLLSQRFLPKHLSQDCAHLRVPNFLYHSLEDPGLFNPEPKYLSKGRKTSLFKTLSLGMH